MLIKRTRALDGLFARLQITESAGEAATITRQIWNLWHKHDDENVQLLMAQGRRLMSRGNFGEAIIYFTEAVKIAPEFAEGWNARATAYYLMGDLDLSTQDVKRTLRLESRHFGALSGQGSIFLQLQNNHAALAFFEKALEYNPHMAQVTENIERIREFDQTRGHLITARRFSFCQMPPERRIEAAHWRRENHAFRLFCRDSATTQRISNIIVAPTNAVLPLGSNGGDTSTTSPPTRLSPLSPRIIICASRVE